MYRNKCSIVILNVCTVKYLKKIRYLSHTVLAIFQIGTNITFIVRRLYKSYKLNIFVVGTIYTLDHECYL